MFYENEFSYSSDEESKQLREFVSKILNKKNDYSSKNPVDFFELFGIEE